MSLVEEDTPMADTFHYQQIQLSDLKHLSHLKGLFDDAPLSIFVPSVQEGNMRQTFDGISTLVGLIKGKKVAVAICDFRFYGGSFGSQNSHRLGEFLKDLTREGIPLLFFVDSMGVRISEGRKVFAKAFKLIPLLKSFAEQNLLITGNLGRCLGLGALLFEMGHYRFAIGEKSCLNLTGPEVFKLFFGESTSFSDYCASEVYQQKTDEIHHVISSKEEMYRLVRRLFEFKNDWPLLDKSTHKKLHFHTPEECSLKKLLEQISLDHMEVFLDAESAVKVYLCQTYAGRFAAVINPPGKANMLNVRAIKKYQKALLLFKSLHLPLISFVDTPGADPRMSESDKGIVGHLKDLTGDIIDYPYFKMGVVLGRCYGGASVVSIPPIFGGHGVLVLEGAHIGIMGDKIIDQLLGDSSKLHSEWIENKKTETCDFSDMIDLGVVDKKIHPSELMMEINTLLLGHQRDQFIEKSSYPGQLVEDSIETTPLSQQ
jgi:acetyl-CoA carboxylase carboxyltransferase component